MNLMQVFLEAFRELGIAKSALERGPRTLIEGIDTARFGEDPHGGLFSKAIA
jgi:hypothetical protein